MKSVLGVSLGFVAALAMTAYGNVSSPPSSGGNDPADRLVAAVAEWKGVTEPDDTASRAEHLFFHALGWHCSTTGSPDLLGVLQDWEELDPQPVAVAETVVGNEGGMVSAPEVAPATGLALEITPGSLSDPVNVTLEVLPNPTTDPMAPTVRFTFSGAGKGPTPKVITGSTSWPLILSFDSDFAGEWSDDLVRDVKIVVRIVGETTWTVLTATIIVADGIATAQLAVTQELIEAGLEVTITTLGFFYQAFHQPEGFLTVTGQYGGTSDLKAALHPQPGQKVLILVHGIFGSSARTWTEKMTDFPNSLRRFYDHIIFAQYRSAVKDDWWRSPRQPARRSCSARAARILWNDLFSQLDDGGEALSQATVHLVGHSQGGVVCRWFFQDYPDRNSTARELIEDGLIDAFLSLDSPQGGLTSHQLCTWIGFVLGTGPLCGAVNLAAEQILGTAFLNHQSTDLRGIPTYAVSVEGGIVIPDDSALFLTDASHELVVMNSTHIRVHQEMLNNEVYDHVLDWFDLQSIPTSIEMVTIPSGFFLMGNSGSARDTQYGFSDEYPRHTVTINYSFQMGKYEVTNAQYAEVLNFAKGRGYLRNSGGGVYNGGNVYHNGQILLDIDDSHCDILYSNDRFIPKSRNSELMSNHPVKEVSWYGGVAFCNWLSEMDGLPVAYNLTTWTLSNRQGGGYRLPSESEWEYACRGSASNPNRYAPFSFGDDTSVGLGCDPNCCQYSSLFDRHMVWCGNYDGWTEPVGSKLPNDYGLYDMHGNLWEWCQDWWHTSYSGAPSDGRAWESTTSDAHRVIRGGSWLSYAGNCRSAYRGRDGPSPAADFIGFRVVRVP